MVDSVLHRLPDHQRIPLVLYHFEELSYQEIAAKLQVSLTKVKTDIFRGRAALLPLLQAGGDARDAMDA
jgi:RNA polymerase sigma-70 factor (ECF subfamily)